MEYKRVLRVRERQRENRRDGGRELYGKFDNISYSKEKRQQLRCYTDTEFLGAK